MAAKRILVVDDDPEMRGVLSRRFRRNGYEVATACDGVSCMSEVRAGRPDLIVLDLGMPAGDGFLTLERLRANDALAGVPVVVLTAREDDEARDRALRGGATRFFQKTVNRYEFLDAIEQLCHGAG